MGIDPAVLARLSAGLNAARALPRVSNSDSQEAKANIIINRAIEAAPMTLVEDIKAELDEWEEEDIQPIAHQGLLPREEDSGLIVPDFVPDPSQIRAIEQLMEKQYGGLIGAAGTGKTTTIKRLVHLLLYGDKERGVDPSLTLRRLEGKQCWNIAFCAFTGTAQQVIKNSLPPWLHDACKTIHYMLEYAPVTTEITTKDGAVKETMIFMPTRDGMNKFDYDVIVIDEFSMVGVNIWHEILAACRPHVRIYTIGDLNQLTPVMSHSVLAYTLDAWRKDLHATVCELTVVHRQKEPAANRIIETAHAILNGRKQDIKFDAQNDPNWRVIGFQLDHNAQKAGRQVIGIANQLRNFRVHPSIDPTTPLIYDPDRDRIITAGNGYDEDNPSSCVQQTMINDALSRLIGPTTDEHPRYYIDAGRSRKKFAVHDRIMATKNEPPDVKDRVTNGMVGNILEIWENPRYDGKWEFVGSEAEVNARQKAMVEGMWEGEKSRRSVSLEELDAFDLTAPIDINAVLESRGNGDGEKAENEGGGWASHSVRVRFINGQERVFASKAAVDSLQLAYASTCHKCQGSQMDTAIIVVHHAVKKQLSREWLYTAITRATKRVVLLYTDLGLSSAIATQRIFGNTLDQKIERYRLMQEQGVGPLKTKVRLYI